MTLRQAIKIYRLSPQGRHRWGTLAAAASRMTRAQACDWSGYNRARSWPLPRYDSSGRKFAKLRGRWIPIYTTTVWTLA